MDIIEQGQRAFLDIGPLIISILKNTPKIRAMKLERGQFYRKIII